MKKCRRGGGRRDCFQTRLLNMLEILIRKIETPVPLRARGIS
jgi:hypothetical protein